MTGNEKTTFYDEFYNTIPQHQLDSLISLWLHEDCPNFDYGAYVVGNTFGEATILCKSRGVLCGKPFVDALFTKLHCDIKWEVNEGFMIEDIRRVATVKGQVKDLLIGERIALNVLARASGIATTCRMYNDIKEKCKWNGKVAGTRKTTPGFRCVEKYALLVGGCDTHRYDVSSMIMLKDNHIWSVGNIASCVAKARNACGFSSKIEVECRSVAEALEACKAGGDVIMLDNFHSSIVERSAAEIKEKYPHILIEVSGGISSYNIANYMTNSIDIISTSTLVQGYGIVDFSMKLLKKGRDPTNPLVTE